jgi:hypothetical protein
MKLGWDALPLAFDAHGILRAHAKEWNCDDCRIVQIISL